MLGFDCDVSSERELFIANEIEIDMDICEDPVLDKNFVSAESSIIIHLYIN